MDMRKKTRKQIMKALERIQFLVGQAKHDYLNDRSNMRADRVIPALEEAFNICIDIRD
jgi:hypothetical protein